MVRAKTELRDECVGLREKGHSLTEIHKITGASKGSLSNWLKGMPLQRERRYVGSFKRKKRLPESALHAAFKDIEYTSEQVGRIAEAAILFRLVLHGFEPYGSALDGTRIDWIVFDKQTKRVLKIQVKTAIRSREGLLYVNTRRPNKQAYEPGDFDFLVGYDFYTDTAFVFRASEVGNKTAGVAAGEDQSEAWYKLRD